MVPDPWILAYIGKGIRSLYARNMGSVGQRAAKLPAIKVWEWFGPGTTRARARAGRQTFLWDLQLWRLVTLKPFDLQTIFLALKDLIPFSKYNKIQGSCSIYRVGFALSKTPHLHRAYLVTVRKRKSMTVCKLFSLMWNLKIPIFKALY